MSPWVRLRTHDTRSSPPANPRTRPSGVPPAAGFSRRRYLRSIVTLGLMAAIAAVWSAGIRTRAQSAPPAAAMPGAMGDGTTLLPNGWRIQPAGKHVRVGDMPLNLVQTPDSRYLIVTSNGLARPSFSVVDIASWSIKSTMTLDHAWYGLVWHPDGTKLYSAGGG